MLSPAYYFGQLLREKLAASVAPQPQPQPAQPPAAQPTFWQRMLGSGPSNITRAKENPNSAIGMRRRFDPVTGAPLTR